MKKFIVGICTTGSTTAYEYTHPFERIVDMTGNLYRGNSNTIELIASTEQNVAASSLFSINTPQHQLGDYKYIGLRATFTTAAENVYKGSYGLLVVLTDIADTEYSFVFDSTEMYGNPYYYDSGFGLEKVFAYPSGVTFKSGQIFLYADEELQSKNFKVLSSDIYMTFAYDQGDFTQTSFTINMLPGISQEYGATDNKEKKIETSLISFNDEDKKYDSYDSNNYALSWYRYRVGNADVGAGSHWEKLFNTSAISRDLLTETISKTKLKRLQEINLELNRVKELEWAKEEVEIFLPEVWGTTTTNNFTGYTGVFDTQSVIDTDENNLGSYLYKARTNDAFELYCSTSPMDNNIYNFDLEIENSLEAPEGATFFLCSQTELELNLDELNNDAEFYFVKYENKYYKVLYQSEIGKEKFQRNFSFESEEINNLVYFINCYYNNEQQLVTFRKKDPQLRKLYSLIDEYNSVYEQNYHLDCNTKTIINDEGDPLLTPEEAYEQIESYNLSNSFNGVNFVGKTGEGQYRLTEFPYVNYQKDQLKAQVNFNGSSVESNTLTFNFKGTATEIESADVNSQIVLTLGDSGHYPYYKDNNELNFNYDNSPKTITVSFADTTPWSKAKEIKWKISKAIPIEIANEDAEIKSSYEEGNYICYEFNENNESLSNTLKYKLDGTISAASISGMIYCYVLDDNGNESSAKVELTFGKYSSSGTNYLIDVTDENDNRPWKFLVWNPKETIQETKYLKARIIDTRTGKPVELTDDEKQNFKWEWAYEFDNEFYSRDLDGSFGDQLEAWADRELSEKATQISSNFEERGALKSFQCTSLGEYNISIIKLSYLGFNLENDTEADLVEYFPVPVVAINQVEQSAAATENTNGSETYQLLLDALGEGIKGKIEFVYDTSGKVVLSDKDKTPYGFQNDNISFVYGTLLTEDISSIVPTTISVRDSESQYEYNLTSSELTEILYSDKENDSFKSNPYIYDYNGDTLVDDIDIQILKDYESYKDSMVLSKYLETIGLSSYTPYSFYLEPAAMSLDGSSLPWCTLYLEGQTAGYYFAWQQPLIIRYDTHGTKLLNEWNGKVILDEDNNAVLASMLVAGEKNKLNQFTGVVIGDVQKAYDDIDGYGVYGFKNGTNRFRLDEDGNFFVGQKDGSYLSFDDEGFMLKLKNGNFIIESNNFNVDSNGNVSMTGYVKATSGHVGNWLITEGRIETGSWDPDELAFISTGTEAWMGNDVGNKEWMLYFKNKFGVTTDGTLYAYKGYIGGDLKVAAASITGKLTADQIEASALTVDTISVDKITGGTNSSNITFSGNIVVSNGNITCNSLTANSSGYIGGWEIDKNSIHYGTTMGVDNSAFFCWQGWQGQVTIAGNAKSGEWVLGIGSQFGVTKQGDIYMTGFKTTGSSATWKGLQGNTTNTKDLIVGFQNDGIGFGDPSGSFIIAYRSGATGAINGNWRINGNLKGSSSGSIVSDINKKHSIEKLSKNYSILFDLIQPIRYKYNNGTSNRYHTGFIAQQIEKSINDANLTTQDFAGLTIWDQDTDKEEWALRYEEFVALNTWQIQKLKARVEELENKIAQLEQ